MANFHVTDDLEGSIRLLHKKYTHTIVNRAYFCINPVPFDSAGIDDLSPLFYAPWQAATIPSRDRWQANGGVLIDTGMATRLTGARDALVMVDVPLTNKMLYGQIDGGETDIVIYKPHTWATHDWAVELKAPTGPYVRALVDKIPKIAGRDAIALAGWPGEPASVVTDDEMAAATGATPQELLFLHSVMKSREVWAVKLRLAPEDAGALKIWDELKTMPATNGEVLFRFLKVSAWRRPLKELARLGHVTLTRYYVYRSKPPIYVLVQRAYEKAQVDFRYMKKFIDGLPSHV